MGKEETAEEKLRDVLGEVQAAAQAQARASVAFNVTNTANEAARKILEDANWDLTKARRSLDWLLPKSTRPAE